MKPNTDNNTPYYNRREIYKLTCNTCKLSYVGQTNQAKISASRNIYDISGTITHNQHMPNISYTTDMNMDP